MKTIHQLSSSISTKIKLPSDVTITIGAGTVPTSNASISSTSMQDLQKRTQKASRLGVFDSTRSFSNGS